ncbi:monooxygenase [Gordonia sp. CPCC 205515]|uniref:monooxygenase n=1 Tax=Gordonia sp. CPCC 205515 TaxID=3140791 RepID=UPI003AF3FFDF
MTDPGTPVVDVRIWGVRSTLGALRRMAGGRRALRQVPGLRFGKLLGTGSARTFTPRDADPHHWALVSVWDDEAAADAGASSQLVRSWTTASTEELSVRLRPLTSRGQWARREPFGAPTGSREWSGPVAAITRARLRPTRALSFWRAVPPVVSELTDAPGLQLALGIGEAPIGLQGTFSLWESAADLTEFAYRSPEHRAAIRRTNPERWYAEELFARFAVTEVSGHYRGHTP